MSETRLPSSPRTLVRSNLADAPSQQLATAWTYRSSYGVPNEPLLMAGDRLVGLYQNRVLYAVDLFAGRKIEVAGGFPYQCEGDDERLATVAAGAVFFVEQGQLKALRMIDGLPRAGWSAPSIDGVVALEGFDDVVLVVQSSWGDTQVSAYKTEDGSPAWGPYPVSAFSRGAVALGTDAIFFIAESKLFAVNTRFGDVRFPRAAADGTPAPTYELDQTKPPLVTADAVVCAGRQLYGFDIRTGAKLWSLAGPDTATTISWSATLAADRGQVVAVSSLGQAYALDPKSGRVIWQTTLPAPGVPVVGGASVYVVTADHTRLFVLDAGSGAPQGTFDVGERVSDVGPVIGNGTIFVPTTEGDIVAKPYDSDEAAHFDGTTSVAIAPDPGWFEFGNGDFTMEAWVRGTQGGEILSAYPSPGDPTSHGFRLHLTEQGEVCFAAINADGSSADLAKSLPTHAADGFWHHVAALRATGEIRLFVDGHYIATATLQMRGGQQVYRNDHALDANGHPILDQLTPPPPPQQCYISGQLGLAIGAYVGNGGRDSGENFVGLIREVRIWDIAVEASKLQSRMGQVLPPNVPHLRGNWHLDAAEGGGVVVENDVEGHEFPAMFTHGTTVATDLDLDDSAFPYLLDQVTLQWPYAGHWSARGEHNLETRPALSQSGVVCFGTVNELYGVNKSDGQRRWGVRMEKGFSAPASYGSSFYVFTHQFGLITIDGVTGAHREVPGFEGFLPSVPGARLAAPVADSRFIAAAAPDGRLRIRDLLTPGDAPPRPDVPVGSAPGNLTLAGGKVCGVASGKLFVVDAATGATQQIDVTSDVFHVHDGWLFSVQGGILTVTDLTGQNAPRQTLALAGGDVTGMAASADDNLVAVATRNGVLWGFACATLAQRWQTTIPDGAATGAQAAAGWLNAPAVTDRDVFVTTRSGAVAAVDGRNGQLRGLFFESTAVITPPLVDEGAVYFGCAEAAPKQHLDGALHSVVFGETYALRLGLDPLDQPDRNPGYAVIAQPDGKCALQMMGMEETCVEAWINTSAGGEIVSVCPNESGRFGMRLWVATGDEGDEIHFKSWDRLDAGWETLYARAKVGRKLCDGRWHHVAASSRSKSDIRIYLDGVVFDDKIEVESGSAATPPALATGLLAYLGADATGSGSVPANQLAGLIGEVRIWDNYLEASQISDRMHVKLRGNEADLLAYWNFDTLAVHDASANRHDGKLAPDDGDAAFWLADLTFEHPTYPWLETKARITQVGDAGAKPGDAGGNTVYELIVTARKADGTALSGTPLELWYVKHEHDDGPDSIDVGTFQDSATLPAVAPDHEMLAGHSFQGLTDGAGQLTLAVTTSDRDHGPSLDLRAGSFMPANERFHINVLIDNQKLDKPAPPTLAAQSKLIQDYHWATGARIDTSRGRQTYRTVLIAQNADHGPRGGERLELWADEPATIEVAGVDYEIGPHNSAAFYADPDGELTVVIAAAGLTAPHLSVWAGFMNRQDRYVVDVTQDAHGALATVEGDAMVDPNRMTEWRSKDEGGPQRGALLGTDYKPHADKIADAVQHVMATTQPKDATSASTNGGGPRLQAVRSGGRGLRASRLAASGAAAPLLGDDAPDRRPDMRQPVIPVRADSVRLLRAPSHIRRRIPISPEAMRRSIDQADEGAQKGAIGFVLSGDTTQPISYVTTPAELAAAMGTSTLRPPAPQPLRGIFSSIWHAVTHVVEDLYAAAKRIAIQISDKVTIALHSLDGVIHIVVNSIKDAVNAVVGFLEQIALKLWDIIKFLMFLFDWDAILRTHEIVKQMIASCVDRVEHEIGAGTEHIEQLLASLADRITGQPSLAGAGGMSVLDYRAQNPDDHSSALGGDSVAGKMVYSKTKEGRDGIAVPGSDGLPDSSAGDPLDAVAHALTDLIGLLPQMLHMSLADLGNALLDAAKRMLGTAMGAVIKTVAEALKLVASGLRAAIKALDNPIHIPFVSALYKWLTGNELSILDVFALIVAIPTNIVYGVVTGGGHFDEAAEAKSLPALIMPPAPRLLAAVPDGPEPAPVERPAYNDALEACYVTFRSLNLIFVGGTDLTFIAQMETQEDTRFRNILKIGRGLTGLTATSLLYSGSSRYFLDRVNLEIPGFEDRDTFYGATSYKVRMLLLFIAGLIGDGITLGAGVKGTYGMRNSGSAPYPGQPGGLDKTEFVVLLARSVIQSVQTVISLIDIGEAPEYQDKVSHPLKTAAFLFFLRDLATTVVKLPGFMFTLTAANRVRNNVALYEKIMDVRLAAGSLHVGLHAMGEYGYLRPSR